MKKIETIVEYQQLASRTCPDLDTPELNLLHMNLGISTEIGEFLDAMKKNIAYNKPLDVVNLSEELADMSWYIANKSRIFYKKSWTEELEEKSYEVLLGEVKEYLDSISGIDINTKVAIILTSIIQPMTDDFTKETFNGVRDMAILSYVADIFEIDFFQSLTNNINKLKVRYPEKFNEKDALERNLEEERKQLEK